MPTYEYKCKSCGKVFQKFQSMTEAPLAECPTCKGSVERIVGTDGGLIFKGAGFHRNNYPSTQSSSSRCGRETPCCGRDSFCGSPKCET
ncbi:MAG: zinc ribbon domain-containing protein [Fibrobacter sp.]|nr:zinc ribbon domain-containing protein [Fibrobacter sp.]